MYTYQIQVLFEHTVDLVYGIYIGLRIFVTNRWKSDPLLIVMHFQYITCLSNDFQKHKASQELQGVVSEAEQLIVNNIQTALLTPDIFLGVIAEQNLMGVQKQFNKIIHDTFEVEQGQWSSWISPLLTNILYW